ncbi:MOSC domain-containing protein [Amycolatopsis pigmentata]|uniref:MOSC domain-containing protein n=1 Tax=Amycolatopsis pigmentata TaxID=450801 RepID=A0ABW5FXM8_9PSEU
MRSEVLEFHGTVAGLYRWPVKSLAGERIEAARLDERGLAGDRSHVLIDRRPKHDGHVLTVRQNAALLGWGSFYGPDVADPDGPPALRTPDGGERSWSDPTTAGALACSLGFPLELRDAVGSQDRGPTVHVTMEASRAELAQELSAPVELERFRPNVHLSLDAPAFAEEQWSAGTTITIGEVALEVVGDDSGPCIRCAVPSWDPAGRERWPELQRWLINKHDNKFGVIMRVTRAGAVGIGDTATARPIE